jgi:hypothetical protein
MALPAGPNKPTEQTWKAPSGSLNKDAVAGPVSVSDALGSLIKHPFQHLLRRWNWKSAFLSSVLRGAIFFASNINHGLSAAVGAMNAEIIYRAITAGFYGALIQAFRHVRPAWTATLATAVLVPGISHLLEFLVHWIRGTENLVVSILASVGFTVLSAVFNLFVMRRGALVVGESPGSLGTDLKRMPGLMIAFLLSILRGGTWLL